MNHTLTQGRVRYHHDNFSDSSRSGRLTPKSFIFIIGLAIATAHTAEDSYGRQPHLEVTKVKGLSPPGLAHECLPSYSSNTYFKGVRTEPKQNTIANQIKEDKTLNGLRIATINVTSWSSKIIRMISHMAA